MLIVKLKSAKDIDRALKNLKTKVRNTGLIKELRNRKEYKKPTTEKREEKKNAIYKQKMIDKENN